MSGQHHWLIPVGYILTSRHQAFHLRAKPGIGSNWHDKDEDNNIVITNRSLLKWMVVPTITAIMWTIIYRYSYPHRARLECRVNADPVIWSRFRLNLETVIRSGVTLFWSPVFVCSRNVVLLVATSWTKKTDVPNKRFLRFYFLFHFRLWKEAVDEHFPS